MSSKPTYRHYGKVIGERLLFYNEKLYTQTLASLEGKEFDLVLKEKHKRVSLDTHGYYRGGILKECRQYEIFGGWQADEIHDFFANMFLKHTRIVIISNRDGSTDQYPVTVITSTASLSQKEMNEFIDKVIAWLAGQGIIIHTPEEYYLGKYATIYKQEESK